MKAIHRIILTGLALCLVQFSGKAQETALQFSRFVQNPAAAGMGGSEMTSTDNIAYSAYGNIAAAAFSELKMDVAVSYQLWGGDSIGENFINAGGGFKIGEKAVLGANFTYGINDEYYVYDSNGNSNGSFTPSDLQFALGFGYRINDIFSVGVNARVINSSLSDDDSYTAFAGDIMGMAKIPFGVSAFKAAAGVRNVGSSVEASDGEKYSIPSSAAIALGIETFAAKKHKIDASADLDYFFEDGLAVSAGAAYTYNKLLSARLGIHTGGIIPTYASFGLGVNYKGVKLDAAYILPLGEDADGLKNTFCVGIGYSF